MMVTRFHDQDFYHMIVSNGKVNIYWNTLIQNQIKMINFGTIIHDPLKWINNTKKI